MFEFANENAYDDLWTGKRSFHNALYNTLEYNQLYALKISSEAFINLLIHYFKEDTEDESKQMKRKEAHIGKQLRKKNYQITPEINLSETS